MQNDGQLQSIERNRGAVTQGHKILKISRIWEKGGESERGLHRELRLSTLEELFVDLQRLDLEIQG